MRGPSSGGPAVRRLGVLVLALLLLWTVSSGAQLLAPGPLARGHANLEGDEKCDACHSAGRGISNQKCAGCHAPIAREQALGTGLHGRKFKGQSCAQCHSDHHGRDFSLIRWEPQAFHHEDAGWALRGAHAKTACNGCHKTKSYIGLSQSCASCHADPHQARFGAQCASCHGEASWNQLQLSRFDHELARYPLRGAHASVACAKCHQGSPPHYKELEFSSCTSCHQDPHQGKLGSACERCHKVDAWKSITFAPGAHPGLSLANGHARAPCAKCHDRGPLQAPSSGRACVGCHRPVHEASFGRRCEGCHESIQWLGLPRAVGLSAHSKTSFPLRGEHVGAPCAGCHKPELPENTRFRGLSAERCDRCHRDAHDRRFADRNGGECKTCHSERGFKPSSFGVALHQTTHFALEGRHAAVPCNQCHSALANAVQRLDWSLEQQSCAGCHRNPHGTQFQREMKQGGCAACHTSLGWGAPRVDHSLWPLTGAHASTACASCHSPSPQDRKAGKGPSYRGVPRACEGCHQDVHRGQFRLSEPKRTCEQCHSTVEFAIRNFDHEANTGFALAGRHQTLECSQCHGRSPTAAGVSAVRYRLGYRRCRDCHADPHAGAESRRRQP